MLLLVGLGNPGPKYERNRHNVGFMAVDAIVRRHSFQPWRVKFEGLAAEGAIDGVKTLALKPQTYMNNSGQSVGAALRFYKLTPGQVVVLYDEVDLVPFKVRAKTGGGTAGHNGIRSIDQHIGPDFRRVRIGVGHPGDKDKMLSHVLNDFAKAEQADLDKVIDAIAEAAPLLAQDNDNAFMTKVALLTQPPREPKAPKAPPPPSSKQEND
ncbi:MAG: aminoacyl-tRNA hydrolase [Alphaproteobacteria bacterium]|nr:aminoacyl-tRNA hydrolase [Alphaproteobacteria bacterium]